MSLLFVVVKTYFIIVFIFSQLSSILILFTVVVQNRFWKPLLKAGSATHVLLGTLGNFQNCHFQEHMDSCFCFFLFVILRSYFGDHFKSKFSKSFLWNSLSCAVATLIVINTESQLDTFRNCSLSLWLQEVLASELESDLRDTVDWGKNWLVNFNIGKT